MSDLTAELNTETKEELIKRYQEIEEKIITAADRADRDIEKIKLVAVGKTHPLSRMLFLKEQLTDSKISLTSFGESRVQELLAKEEEFPGKINWHFIGHLQRNKVKYLARLENVTLIHSLDSLRLAREINKRAKKNDRVMETLLQVNIAEDENKYGFMQDEVKEFLQQAEEFSHLKIKGLMTILPHFAEQEKTRPYFQKMKELQAELTAAGFKLPELSMGMTNDYEIAIEEGATILRVGRALFGPRDY